MIGRLRGILADKQPPNLLVDVQGVGYEIEAPMSTFYQLPETGEEVTLLTHLVVREDAHTLFGFASEVERRLFRDLIKVNGVGAKLALTILSGASVNDFSRCIHDGDAATLTRLPGVGKKTAERLIVEMKDRLKDYDGVSETRAVGEDISLGPDNPVSDAVNALISLGYKPNEASRMVRSVATEDLGSEDIIRRALQAVVK